MIEDSVEFTLQVDNIDQAEEMAMKVLEAWDPSHLASYRLQMRTVANQGPDGKIRGFIVEVTAVQLAEF